MTGWITIGVVVLVVGGWGFYYWKTRAKRWYKHWATQRFTRECPHCGLQMVADMPACPNCTHQSSPWVMKDGYWHYGNSWFDTRSSKPTWKPVPTADVP